MARVTGAKCIIGQVLMSFVASWYLGWYAGQPVEGSGVLMHRLPPRPDNWTWLISNTRVFSPVSEIMCAILCHQTACVAYNFSGGSCTTEGVSEEEVSMSGLASSTFRTYTNAAFGKVTYSVPFYAESGPGNAVDNETCQRWGRTFRKCCFLGYVSPTNWWSVDLGSSMRVYIVDVATANNWVFSNIVVRVGLPLVTDGELERYQILGSYPHEGRWLKDSRFRVSNPEGIVGRYVSIEQNFADNLILCDVNVFV